KRVVSFAFVQKQLFPSALFRRQKESVHERLTAAYRNKFRALAKNPRLIGFTFSSHSSANSCSLAFCAAFRCVGTSTVTRTCKSPWPCPSTFLIPLPLSRKTVAFCVPGGTLIW